MLRGRYTVKIDGKGRIKIPSAYRRFIDETYGSSEFYVTSDTGDFARLYPMREWLVIEEKLQSQGTMDLAVRKFLDRTNYHGQIAEMDKQGRILIHPALRASADLVSDVDVMGYLQYLEVWSVDRFKDRLGKQAYSDEDAASVARFVK
jgi:MraZ protein